MKLEFLSVPVVFIITGIIMLIIPTSSIFAFKTRTASKSPQTQEYCNKLSAKVLIIAGFVSGIAVCATGKLTARFFGMFSVGEFVDLLAVGVLLISIPIVNCSCKRRFPELFYDNMT